MPSPLNGFTEPGRVADDDERRPDARCAPSRPVGSRPPVGAHVAVSGEMPHDAGAVAQNASIRRDVLIDFQPVNVESRPTPTFTVPSPTGKIHP